MAATIFSGSVQRVLYENDDFRILKIVLDGQKNHSAVSVKGHFPAQEIVEGSWTSFEGKWVNHPQYGKQLEVTRSPVSVQTWTQEKVLAALTAHAVGPSTRALLVQHAEDQKIALVDLLDSGDLSQIEDMEEFSAQHTLSRWQGLRTYLDAAGFMAKAGLPSRVVTKVWHTFGADLEGLLTKDPWILVRVPGISFREVDEIAIRLGLTLDNPGRVRGAVFAAVQDTTQEGHTFASTGQVVDAVRKRIPGKLTPPKQIVQSIKDLALSELIVIDKVTDPRGAALYDKWYYDIEKKCAELLARRMQVPLQRDRLKEALCLVGDRVRDVASKGGASLGGLATAALENWAIGRQTELTDAQTQAALSALVSKVSLLTGLPGTGKTTTLRAVVAIARDAEIPFLLAAPTGIAAKRMSALTGAPASTIHRAFGARGFMDSQKERDATYVGITGSAEKSEKRGGGTWGYGPGNPHPAKFLVVDESSMLDLHMLYRLLSGTSEDCRVMFVGDPYQLPSVGAGDVLRDLVRSKMFPHSHLTKIFRQAGTSGIVLAAHAIHAGKAPRSDGKDFVLKSVRNERKAADVVVAIAEKLYGLRRNFQVLSPRHGGDAGVTALNQRLRLALNPALPGLREMKLGGSVVREGDRVMIVKNDYDKGVYNGDVGKISHINPQAKSLEIKVHEGPDTLPRIVPYLFKEATKAIRLAYAQTVHKSQGQEYDVIVLPLLPQFGRQLQRNLFYTAVTRAKQKVYVVGSTGAIERAVLNNLSASRNSLLSRRVQLILTKGVT